MKQRRVKLITIKRVFQELNVYHLLKHDMIINTNQWKLITEKQLIYIIKFIKLLTDKHVVLDYFNECEKFDKRHPTIAHGSILPMVEPQEFIMSAFGWYEAKINWEKIHQIWIQIIDNTLFAEEIKSMTRGNPSHAEGFKAM